MELLCSRRAEAVLSEGDDFALQRFAGPSGHWCPAGAAECRALLGEKERFLPFPGEGRPFHADVARDGVARDRFHRHKTDSGLGLGPLPTVDDEMADGVGLRWKDDVLEEHRADFFRAKSVELHRDDREGAKSGARLGDRAEDRADVFVLVCGSAPRRWLCLTEASKNGNSRVVRAHVPDLPLCEVASE